VRRELRHELLPDHAGRAEHAYVNPACHCPGAPFLPLARRQKKNADRLGRRRMSGTRAETTQDATMQTPPPSTGFRMPIALVPVMAVCPRRMRRPV
jgi:hypothetical protein